ncbi:MAG: thioesterase [Polaribacter sp.]|nr:MAG: thioesterase [Polaribacter sp.]
MEFTPRKINMFTLFKLPSAYLAGVRVKSITDENSVVTVKHRWLNQNPFKSMFWAVQGMAAELSSGILVMKTIKNSNKRVSMLVVDMNATFSKKAVGRIYFECNEGEKIKNEIQKAIETGEGRTFVVTSKGINQQGVEVSKFQFTWSVKVKV